MSVKIEKSSTKIEMKSLSTRNNKIYLAVLSTFRNFAAEKKE